MSMLDKWSITGVHHGILQMDRCLIIALQFALCSMHLKIWEMCHVRNVVTDWGRQQDIELLQQYLATHDASDNYTKHLQGRCGPASGCTGLVRMSYFLCSLQLAS